MIANSSHIQLDLSCWRYFIAYQATCSVPVHIRHYIHNIWIEENPEMWAKMGEKKGGKEVAYQVRSVPIQYMHWKRRSGLDKLWMPSTLPKLYHDLTKWEHLQTCCRNVVSAIVKLCLNFKNFNNIYLYYYSLWIYPRATRNTKNYRAEFKDNFSQ